MHIERETSRGPLFLRALGHHFFFHQSRRPLRLNPSIKVEIGVQSGSRVTIVDTIASAEPAPNFLDTSHYDQGSSRYASPLVMLPTGSSTQKTLYLDQARLVAPPTSTRWRKTVKRLAEVGIVSAIGSIDDIALTETINGLSTARARCADDRDPTTRGQSARSESLNTRRLLGPQSEIPSAKTEGPSHSVFGNARLGAHLKPSDLRQPRGNSAAAARRR